MSHVYTYKERILNVEGFAGVVESQGGEAIVMGKHRISLYGSNSVDCIMSAKLPGWRYQLGVTDKGEIKYDNFGSKPGSMEKLYKAVQSYWAEEIRQGIDYTEVSDIEEETLENGDIKIAINFD